MTSNRAPRLENDQIVPDQCEAREGDQDRDDQQREVLDRNPRVVDQPRQALVGAGWLMLVVFYDRNKHLLRYPSWLGLKPVSRRKLFRDNALRVYSLGDGST